ncbi:uncharacterized protein LOC130806583 [Amaranthus tricolor]|uniref:uncharacterized protein LOC130806583 n=1 Tax=Amaranthus tricolor TaxID=29722 RepID=UPI002586717B|nr:uncharacterized protein LOC130806583 [Amaranthus tricolor]
MAESDRNEESDYSSEDEGTEDYRKGGYHAVRIGDVFKSGRYVVQKKLGWGHFSTVWLAWDIQKSMYVALKVQKSAKLYTEAAMDEIKILKLIANDDPDDTKCVVKLLDHFKHSGSNGHHVCMVFQYLGDNLLTLIKYSDYKGIPLQMVKEICFYILVALDYLHQKLSMIHTDLKPENVLLLSMIDPSKDPRKTGSIPLLPTPKSKPKPETRPLEVETTEITNANLTRNQKKKVKKKAKRVAQKCAGEEASGDVETNTALLNQDTQEESSPIPKSNENSVEQGKRSYRWHSRATRQRLLKSVDPKCKLVDFGNTCWTYKKFTSDIQTRQYRCPEVILGSKYSTSADLWSFACICFELATGDVLFDPHHGDNYSKDEDHLAQMMELLGVMPRKVASSGRRSSELFNKYGDLKHIRELKFWPLNKVLMEKYDFGEQDANDLADFLIPILEFVPEKRPTAADCLKHSWINPGPRLREPSVSSVEVEGADHEVCDGKRAGIEEMEEIKTGVKILTLALDSKCMEELKQTPISSTTAKE